MKGVFGTACCLTGAASGAGAGAGTGCCGLIGGGERGR